MQKTSLTSPAASPSPERRRQRLWERPSTPLGWRSVWLGVTFVVLFIINAVMFMPSTAALWQQSVLPVYGIVMLLCGLAAGIIGLLALTRQNERSWLVGLTLLPGAMFIFLLLGEFLAPH